MAVCTCAFFLLKINDFLSSKHFGNWIYFYVISWAKYINIFIHLKYCEWMRDLRSLCSCVAPLWWRGMSFCQNNFVATLIFQNFCRTHKQPKHLSKELFSDRKNIHNIWSRTTILLCKFCLFNLSLFQQTIVEKWNQCFNWQLEFWQAIFLHIIHCTSRREIRTAWLLYVVH